MMNLEYFVLPKNPPPPPTTTTANQPTKQTKNKQATKNTEIKTTVVKGWSDKNYQ